MAKQLSPSEQGETFAVPRLDVHDLVTTTIIGQLEQGVIPWQKPFKDNSLSPFKIPTNHVTGNRYRGINIVLLWAANINRNHTTDDWASFKQWQSKNERIRKGEKGNLVVYYDTFEKETDGEKKQIPFLKSSYVFNRCQLEGYVSPEPEEHINTFSFNEKIEGIEAFVENTDAIIESHAGGASYIPSTDKIMMPFPENFFATDTCTAVEGYYSTLMHELTHWVGAEKRLNRTKGKRFGDQNYANEELVAEFGAAFLCAGFGLATVEKGDHTGYIEHWLKVLREDNRAIFRAASEASKAVDYLNVLQPF